MLEKVPNIFAQNIFLTNRALMFRAFLESIMHLLLRYLRPSWYLEIVTVNIDDTFNVQYIILLTKYFPTDQKTKWFPERPLAWSRMIAQPCSLHCLYSVLCSLYELWILFCFCTHPTVYQLLSPSQNSWPGVCLDPPKPPHKNITFHHISITSKH